MIALSNLEAEIEKGEAYLAGQDPALAKLIRAQGKVVYASRGDYFYSLCRSIIGQQVSMAAARSIFNRFETASGLEPARVLALSDEDMKQIGLSRQKTSYIRDLASHFATNPKVYNHLDNLSDEDVIAELCAVKGIGAWTAQMFLMFTLARLDVFAPDDIGLQRAMKELYGWESVPSRKELIAYAELWRPYRTVASWHLWKSLNNSGGGTP